MQEKSVLTDCLESLKHVARMYQDAVFECDNDHVRDTLQDIMFDRVEQQASVFSLMHQMGFIETQQAGDETRVTNLLDTYQGEYGKMEQRHQAAEGPDATDHKFR